MHDLKNNLKQHKARFLEIMECEDESIKKMRLEALENDMVACYDIPQTGNLRIGAFGVSFPEVYNLYRRVKNERWT